MELTKKTLKQFLRDHPAISPRALCLHAGIHGNAINQMYNLCDRNLTEELKDKLLKVVRLYGWPPAPTLVDLVGLIKHRGYSCKVIDRGNYTECVSFPVPMCDAVSDYIDCHFHIIYKNNFTIHFEK